MANIPFYLIVLIFTISALVTWFAGITLAKATDTLDSRLKIGDALGGLILLGIAGSLPEIAVTFTAALHGNTEIIIGNLIGGLSIQVLILVLFDFVSKGKRPLSYHAGSIMMSIETIFAIILTLLAIGGMYMPEKYNIVHVSPISYALVIMWVVGLLFINKLRKVSRLNKTAGYAEPGRLHRERRSVENHHFFAGKPTWGIVLSFLIAAALTLVAGYYLERSGDSISRYIGFSSGIFAATAMAFVTALPEISTGLESIFIGDNQLAISDIMGGNAFMLIIFFLADIVGKKPTLRFSTHGDLMLAILAIAMMLVYGISFLTRPKRKFLRLGIDSIIVILIYIAGIYLITKII
jgi:cation:H+ antiporter